MVHDVSASELSLITLPARLGGMGINDPVDSVGIAFSTSRTCRKKIVHSIKGTWRILCFYHNNQMHEAKKQQKVALNTSQQSTLASIMTSLSGDKKRAVKRAVHSKAKIWLTVIPVSYHHFDLSPTEFRDALALRYPCPFLKVPAECDGCGDKFTFQHALDCRKGRFVTQRHNEVRDALGDLASIAFKGV